MSHPLRGQRVLRWPREWGGAWGAGTPGGGRWPRAQRRPQPPPAAAPRPPGNPEPRGAATVAQTRAMEAQRDRDALGGGTGADAPESPQEPPPSPPSPPSPLSPATPESPQLPKPEPPAEAHARQLLLDEWRPLGGRLQLPPRLTWKLLLVRRPLYRNLLRSPNPEGADAAPAPPGPSGSSSWRLGFPVRCSHPPPPSSSFSFPVLSCVCPCVPLSCPASPRPSVSAST